MSPTDLLDIVNKSICTEIEISRDLKLLYFSSKNLAYWMTISVPWSDRPEFLTVMYHGPNALLDAIKAFNDAVKEGYRVP